MLKVSETSSLLYGEDGFIGIERNTLDFVERNNGEHVCVLPLKLPNSGAAGDTRKFITTVPVTIRSSAETAKGGRVRYMVQVAIPYTAVSPAVADDSIVANQFDSKRSGGTLKMHLVVELPKAAADDLKGTFGSTCQRAASAQIAVLKMLIASLADDLGCPLTYLEVDTSTYVSTRKNVTFCSSDVGITAGPGTSVPSRTGNAPHIAGLTEFPGVMGIDASAATGLAGNLKSGLVRALNGLSPIDSTCEVVTPEIIRATTD